MASGKNYTNRDIRYVDASRAPVSETPSAQVEEAPSIDFDAPPMEVGEIVISTTSPLSLKDRGEMDLFNEGSGRHAVSSGSEGIYKPLHFVDWHVEPVID